jgi:predicted membrane channel-forming protein YqfA (hemolysin III family)
LILKDAGSLKMLYLVALAWMYVVLMVALAEAFSPQGTVLGAVFTVLGWGVIPLSIVLYILATPSRRAARKARESAADEDGGGHAAGDPVAPEREEP